MGKNFRYKSLLRQDEIFSQIIQSTKIGGIPTDFRFVAFLNEGLHGNIKDNAFWLQYTKPHLLAIPQRYFEGVINHADGGTIITGKFKYTSFYKTVSAILVLCITILSILLRLTGEKHSFIPLFFVLPTIIASCFSPMYFKEEEVAVILFLEKISGFPDG